LVAHPSLDEILSADTWARAEAARWAGWRVKGLLTRPQDRTQFGLSCGLGNFFWTQAFPRLPEGSWL